MYTSFYRKELILVTPLAPFFWAKPDIIEYRISFENCLLFKHIVHFKNNVFRHELLKMSRQLGLDFLQSLPFNIEPHSRRFSAHVFRWGLVQQAVAGRKILIPLQSWRVFISSTSILASALITKSSLGYIYSFFFQFCICREETPSTRRLAHGETSW